MAKILATPKPSSPRVATKEPGHKLPMRAAARASARRLCAVWVKRGTNQRAVPTARSARKTVRVIGVGSRRSLTDRALAAGGERARAPEVEYRFVSARA